MKNQLILIICIFSVYSCNNDFDDLVIKNEKTSLKAISPEVFDWESIDWMPTPANQTKISVPWIGQGSIASLYDNDVLYDYKKADGWELLYSTFTSQGTAQLQNPYFMLYNKYRGMIRIYLYTTTQFVYPSSYLQDGLSLVGRSSKLLQFAGQEIVDVENLEPRYVCQIQSEPRDGSKPLATNKWYMFEYEMAYDPNISSWLYNKTQLSWHVNFCNVTEMNFSGDITGEIKSVISESSKSENVMSALQEGGNVIGIMGLSAIGSSWLENRTINSYYGTNDLNLPESTWKALNKGVNSALSGAIGDLPDKVVNLFNAVIGVQNNQPQLNFEVDLEIKLKGSASEQGSLPSSPTSFWVPGSIMNSQTQGYVPLYNKQLGIISFKKNAQVYSSKSKKMEWVKDPKTGDISFWTYKYSNFSSNNWQENVVINPCDDYTVSFVKTDIICDVDNIFCSYNANGSITEHCEQIGTVEVNPNNLIVLGGFTFNAYVRYTFKVTPKNGTKPTYIIKTLKADFAYE